MVHRGRRRSNTPISRVQSSGVEGVVWRSLDARRSFEPMGSPPLSTLRTQQSLGLRTLLLGGIYVGKLRRSYPQCSGSHWCPLSSRFWFRFSGSCGERFLRSAARGERCLSFGIVFPRQTGGMKKVTDETITVVLQASPLLQSLFSETDSLSVLDSDLGRYQTPPSYIAVRPPSIGMTAPLM